MKLQSYEVMVEAARRNELSVEDINMATLLFAQKIQEIKKSGRNVKETVSRIDEKVSNMEKEYPLLSAECDDLQKAVRKKGVQILGGKNSNAYSDVKLRKRVYIDIYNEVKRQYGLDDDETGRRLSYKKLKRKYFKGALQIIANYEPPIVIANDIDEANEEY